MNDIGGNPTKFTEAVRERVISVLKLGTARPTAARAALIAPNTLSEWITRGRIDHENGRPTAFAEFFTEVEQAEAGAKLRMEAVIRRHAEGNPLRDKNGKIRKDKDGKELRDNGSWQAASWWLERRYRDEYGHREPPPVVTVNVTSAESSAVLEDVRRAFGLDPAPAPAEDDEP